LANPRGLEESKRIADYCAKSGRCKFYAITSSISEDIKNVCKKYNISYNFYSADQTTLKTIIRSNPGLLLLKNGTIIGKWHYNNMHTVSLNIDDNYIAQSLAHLNNLGEWTAALNIIIGLGLLLSFLWALSIYLKTK
jgi:triosephosphate isomerase